MDLRVLVKGYLVCLFVCFDLRVSRTDWLCVCVCVCELFSLLEPRWALVWEDRRVSNTTDSNAKKYNLTFVYLAPLQLSFSSHHSTLSLGESKQKISRSDQFVHRYKEKSKWPRGAAAIPTS